MNLLESEEFQANLIESIINPHIPTSGKQKRARSAPTKIKTLYHLYQLQKNVKNGKWSKNFQGKTKISEHAGITKRHFSEFVNNPDFKLFGSVHHRYGTTNIYILESWVYKFFDSFEKKGMMRFFRQDFDRWRENFTKRFHNWLLPLLMKGNTLSQILINKISTKPKLKGVGSETLKGVGIKPSGSSYEAFQGFKSNTENLELPAFNDFSEVSQVLCSRFSIREGDVNMLMKSFSLNHHKKACSLMDLWKKRGMQCNSPVRVYQTCLSRTRLNVS